jgi:transmembrane sensor
MSKEGKDILKNKLDSDFEMFLESSSKMQVPPSKTGKEGTWDKLLKSIENEEIKESKVVSMPLRTIWISIAASILFLFTIALLNYRYSMVEFVSPKGIFADIILPDSSEIKLNADSRINYRKYGWSSNREIKLSGEAFFTVKHGNKFTVLTENERKIVVTGTKFNVFARGAQFEVKCFDGSVRVESPKTKPVSLTKGNGISLNKTEELIEIIVADSILSPKWITGDFYYFDRPFNEVLDEISRQFNVNITTDFSAESRNYTGFFNKRNLIQALDLACIPMGLTYQLSADSSSVRIGKKQISK